MKEKKLKISLFDRKIEKIVFSGQLMQKKADNIAKLTNFRSEFNTSAQSNS